MRRGGGYLKTGQKSFSFPPHSFPSNLEVTGARLPEGIQDCAIGEEANESVSHGDFVEEGLFGLHDVSVWWLCSPEGEPGRGSGWKEKAQKCKEKGKILLPSPPPLRSRAHVTVDRGE